MQPMTIRSTATMRMMSLMITPLSEWDTTILLRLRGVANSEVDYFEFHASESCYAEKQNRKR
jgi:hypothetical protein